MNLIKNEENKEMVNLDKVTCICPDANALMVCFVFDSMNADEVNVIKWMFKDLDSFNNFMYFIGSSAIEV